MPPDKIDMNALKTIALAEIRARRGCGDIAEVSIFHVTDPRSKSNWSLTIIDYGSADRDAAQLAALVVQRDLQRKYELIVA